MSRYFNIAGPCNAKDHYMIDVFKRGGTEMLRLAEHGHYFVLHAARQSGKTTLLWELIDKINADGNFYALYCSLEIAQGIADAEKAIPSIVKTLKHEIKRQKLPVGFAVDADYDDFANVLNTSFSDYCDSLQKPLIIFFDEADCLSDNALISFLRQLRSGFVSKSRVPFVHSVSLTGMRNIRDYKARIRPDAETLGTSSPFNIVTKAIGLPTFTLDETKELYSLHTAETGQLFESAAIDLAFEQSGGHPWLVNAIAREVVEDILQRDYSKTITRDHVETAAQNIILARGTHIDSLMERLKEPRVRNIILPLILGEEAEKIISDDYLYVKDLGLIKEIGGKTEPANPIYAELIVRALSSDAQDSIRSAHENYIIPRYIKNGKIDMNFLIADFQTYWRENSEIWRDRYKKNYYEYDEAATHLILQAFLQRVINGGGQIAREMALGAKRADLCVIYDGHKYPIELKILQNIRGKTETYEQILTYMDKCGCDEGWLLIFDRDEKKSWDEKIYMRTETINGKQITVAGA